MSARMQRPTKHATPALLMLALSLAGCGGSTETLEDHAEERTSGQEAVQVTAPLRLPSNVAPTRYALSLQLDPAQERFTGIAEIDVTLTEALDRMWIHGENLTVTEATASREGADPVAVTWELIDAEEGVARIVFPSTMEPGNLRLRIAYSAPFDETLEGLYRVHIGEDHYVFSQFESIAARKAFPCFDEPRFKVPFDVTLTIPNGQRAFALRRTAGVVWIVAQVQIEAVEKWSIEGPWEVSLAMRNTAGATLGDFAEGWAEFGDFRHSGIACREAHILHRWTIDTIDPPSLALEAGARIENSFGTTHRRHLAARGEYEGQFDPRFGW